MTYPETIELLQPNDEIAQNFCAEYLSNTWNLSIKEMRDRLEKYAIGANGEFCVLAKINGNLIGMMAFFQQTVLRTDGDYKPWSAGLYVDERYRKHGIGTRILEKVLSEARIRGFKKVHLGTDKEHLCKWYSSLGWKQIGKAYEDDHEYTVFVFEF